MRRTNVLLAIVVGCGTENGSGHDDAPVTSTVSCVEQLAPLREELQWADDALRYPGYLAAVPEWRATADPPHLLSVRLDELSVDDQRVTDLRSVDDEADDWARRFPDADPHTIRLELEHAAEQRLRAPLKTATVALAGATIALAFEPDTRWEFVAPLLRIASERDEVVPLLVAMPFPPWWDSRPFDELFRDSDGLGQVARVLSLRLAEVFADCPAAFTNGASPNAMVRYVDAIAACDCQVDLAAARELLHALATPTLAPTGVLELRVVDSGDGAPFVAEPTATWSEVLPRLLAAPQPIVLPQLPALPPTADVPPPPPAQARKRRR